MFSDCNCKFSFGKLSRSRLRKFTCQILQKSRVKTKKAKKKALMMEISTSLSSYFFTTFFIFGS